jgi:putative chitinase
MPLTVTAADLKRFAPKAKKEYSDALLGNLELLAGAGILDTAFRLCHFLAQCGAETAGLTVLRESLKYTPNRLKVIFPKRFRSADDGLLAELVKDPVALADAVYGGRMGNRKGTSDGYDFRGGGFLQVTGRANVTAYCKELGIPVDASVLDDHVITLQMAILAWANGNCNDWADKNNLLRISKVINTGSAASGVMPNGMQERKYWLGQALKVWANAKPLAEVADVKPDQVDSRTLSAGAMLRRAGEGAAAAGAIKGAADQLMPEVVKPPSVDLTELANQLSVGQKLMETAGNLARFVSDHWWVSLIVIGVVVWVFGHKIKVWYLDNVRTGKTRPVLKKKGT